MECDTVAPVAEATDLIDECYPFHDIVGLIVILIVIVFLCCILNGELFGRGAY